jgi:cyclic pyranopterin phosphate synthase
MSFVDPLIDAYGRVHTNLRVSITDRCNIRCFYCMPNENVQFKPRAELLTFEEIVRFVRVMAGVGVNKVRLTGGEPLVRHHLDDLVRMLAAIPGIEDLALTTNGLLLAQQAEALKRAGLARLNISLDGLQEETFQKISRRSGLDQVLEGIHVASRLGFRKIRLNAVAIAGITESEIVPLGQFAREHGLEMRFIEFMPLDAEGNWDDTQVLSGAKIRKILEDAIAPLEPLTVEDASQPATDYRFADGRGRIGFINPVTEPFCHACNRLRITAEGSVRNCLFSMEEWDARKLLRGGATDDQIVDLVRQSIAAKKPGHGMDQEDFVRPERAMYQIGG